MGIGSSLRSRVVSATETLEGAFNPPGAWVATFLGIVFLRHMLELISSQNPIFLFSQFFLHYALAYLAPLLALTLLLSWFSGERIERVTRLMLFVWCLTLLPPLLSFHLQPTSRNIIFYGIPIDSLGYALPLTAADFLDRLLFFFSPFHRFPGTNWGIRIETLLACLLSLMYVRLKGKGWFRSATASFGVYLTALFFFHLPMIFFSTWKNLFRSADLFSFFQIQGLLPGGDPAGRMDRICIFYLTLLCLVLGTFWLRRFSPPGLGALVRRSAGFPPLFLLASSLPGLILGSSLHRPRPGLGTPAPYDLFALLAILFAVVLAAAGFPASPERPGSRTRLEGSPSTMMDTPWRVTLASGSVLLAFVAGYPCVATMAALLGCLVLLRQPPFALSRIPGLSALGWTLAAFASSLCGYALFAGDQALALLPRELLLLPAAGYAPILLSIDLARLPRPAGAARPLLAAVSLPVVSLLLGLPWPAVAGAALAGGGMAFLIRNPPLLVRSILPAVPPLVAFVSILVMGDSILGPIRERTFAAPRYHILRAFRLESEGNLEAALEARREVVRLSPENPRAYYNLGVVLVRIGQEKEAAEAFKESLRIDPGSPEAHHNLAQVYIALGDPLAAEREIREAIRNWERSLADPSLPEAERRRVVEKIRQLEAIPPAGDQGSR